MCVVCGQCGAHVCHFDQASTMAQQLSMSVTGKMWRRVVGAGSSRMAGRWRSLISHFLLLPPPTLSNLSRGGSLTLLEGGGSQLSSSLIPILVPIEEFCRQTSLLQIFVNCQFALFSLFLVQAIFFIIYFYPQAIFCIAFRILKRSTFSLPLASWHRRPCTQCW